MGSSCGQKHKKVTWSGYARLALRQVHTVDYRDIISTIEECYMPLHVHMVMMVIDVAIIICMFACYVFPF